MLSSFVVTAVTVDRRHQKGRRGPIGNVAQGLTDGFCVCVFFFCPQGQVDRVLGQGQRERARAVHEPVGAVAETERGGRPGGRAAETPVQRVREPHQVIEARRERGSRGGFRSAGRRNRVRLRARRTPAAAATGTGQTAQPQPHQAVQPQDQTADQRHDRGRERRPGRM